MSLSRMTAGLYTSEVAAPLRTIALGFDELPVPTLLEAIQPLIQPLVVIPGVQMLAKSLYDQVVEAKKAGGSFESDALSADGITALMLYSSEDLTPPLYRDMNSKCYIKNRNLVRPYSKYLWLLHDSLKMIEPFEGSTVFRGVKLDLKSHYPKGRKVIWHGPSSCTRAIEVLTTDQFLGSTGVGTIFVVELTQHQARDVTKYSLMPEECEIMLPAGSKFEVVGQLLRGDLTIINLKEVQSDDIFMDLQAGVVAPTSPSTVPPAAPKAPPTSPACAAEVDDWVEHRDPQTGKTFYYSATRNESLWTKPGASSSTAGQPPWGLSPGSSADALAALAAPVAPAAVAAAAVADTMEVFLNHLSSDDRAKATNRGPGTLDLDHMGIDSRGAASLADALKVNKSLVMIYLSGNTIGATGAASLADALKVNKKLETIWLNCNAIGDRGAASLADALKVNQSLVQIFLTNITIGATGAASLADALKVNKHLAKIYVGGNTIGDTGAAALAEALKVNDTLVTINLDGNKIGATGAASLADALKVNKKLGWIHLGANAIGDGGAASLADALKVNKKLGTIWLQDNAIGDRGAASLADALKVNKKLGTIWLQNNAIGDRGREALEGAKRKDLDIQL